MPSRLSRLVLPGVCTCPLFEAEILRAEGGGGCPPVGLRVKGAGSKKTREVGSPLMMPPYIFGQAGLDTDPCRFGAHAQPSYGLWLQTRIWKAIYQCQTLGGWSRACSGGTAVLAQRLRDLLFVCHGMVFMGELLYGAVLHGFYEGHLVLPPPALPSFRVPRGSAQKLRLPQCQRRCYRTKASVHRACGAVVRHLVRAATGRGHMQRG